MPPSTPSLLTVDDDVTVVQGPLHTGPGREGDEPEEEAPRFLGRYMILAELGVGGMGRVFRAYDPELDREVALKQLRRVTADARARLRREAQAMAQLCHPNVLPIYDVADDGRRVFMAMELVRGQSVREWLDVGPRAWEEVLEVFIAAGEGLAAAHDAGLVHRDFKPGNVLLGDDGRVRVMDFGLARGTGEAIDGAQGVRSSGDSWSRGSDDSHSAMSVRGVASAYGLRGTDSQDVLSSLADDLTQMGTVVGTPAYMAPEQHLGHTADPRCDQYGFCVALWEALHGRRPFEAAKIADWYHAKTTATPRTNPDRDVPRWLHAVVLRGLAPRPVDRYASMHQLLRALSQGARWRRYRRSGALALGGVLLLGATFAALHGTQSLCSGADDKLVGIWNLETAAEVEQAVLASKVSYAPDTWARMAPQLDAYAARWQAAHEDACEATHVRNEQPEALMDARMRCLEDRRRSLRALVETLRAADAKTVERAVAAVGALPTIEPCADPEYVRAQAQPPTDPTQAAAVEALEEELARIKALIDAGKSKEVEADARLAVQRAGALGYAPLEALAHHRLGAVEENLGHYPQSKAQLEQAYFIAQREGLDALQASAAIVLIHVVSAKMGLADEGEQWARFAHAALERVHDPALEPGYLNNVGLLASDRGDYEGAIAQLERALALREQLLGPEHPTVATVLNNLALAHDAKGRFDQAQALHERALGIREGALGPEHPDVASSLINLATLNQMMAHSEDALAQLNRAKAIYESAYGSQHPMVGSALVNLGNTYEEMGQSERALESYQKALPILEKSQGPLHTNVAGTHINMGNVYRALDQRERAREHYEKALEILEKIGGHEFVLAIVEANMGSLAFDRDDLASAEEHGLRGLSLTKVTTGPRHPLTATLQANLGLVRTAQGRHDEAVSLHREALDTRREVLGPKHPESAASLVQLGEALLEGGRPQEALEPLEQAAEIFADADAAPKGTDDWAASLQQVRFSVAKARWALGDDRNEARAAITAARDALLRLPGDHAELIEQIDAWLAEHRGRGRSGG
ncbi:serine/threonine-protein kinase [Paraliomyxa miuraensis]|uniref:serine/threonine-protein kinase n=1 Tax=Paraliomyxa miuraensis TaxID=376150 RepID=UPI00225814F0|nr:serine/threonine-protein kinase [Paraliomyxa miuraensis]MCX4247929.1 serine/threonine-protein kinase [Paraliomyxa miuraensis]